MKIIKNLTLASVAATLLFQTSITRADDDQGDARDHRNTTVTWTKWVTLRIPNAGATEAFATVAGVAGGDIGDGTMVGEAFNPVKPLDGGGVTFEADYHFRGSKHSFTVHFIVKQKPDNSGVVEGVVTDGWLKGNRVVGTYAPGACGSGEGAGLSPCFHGTAEIERGSKNKD